VAQVTASDGLSLYAEAHGSGTPVLFSCGLNTTHEHFRPQVAPLVAEGFRVILWDYRGHGESDAPDDSGAYRVEQVLDDLERVLEWGGGGEPAVLAGHSFGGLASLHCTLRRLAEIRALVLIASGPGFKKPEAQAGWVAQLEKTAGFLERKGTAALVEAAQVVGRRPEQPAARAAAEAAAAQSAVGLAHFSREVATRIGPVIDELEAIEVPALVIVGEKDQAYLRAGDVMAARLPRAEKFEVAAAGHVVNLDETEVFNRELIRYLRGFGGPAQRGTPLNIRVGGTPPGERNSLG